MTKTKITIKEYKERLKKGEPALRSCWNCNTAHKHLKKEDYLIYCIWCGNLYLKGKEVEIEGDEKHGREEDPNVNS